MCVSIRLCADAFATCVHLHFVHGVSTERWLFHQCNMLCGSVIRAVGVIDTLPESWLPGVPFCRPSPVWDLSPPPPSSPCKLWLRHFCEVSLSRAHAFVFLSPCAQWVFVGFHAPQLSLFFLPSSFHQCFLSFHSFTFPLPSSFSRLPSFYPLYTSLTFSHPYLPTSLFLSILS